jgi:hypothetical protein
MAGDIVLIDYFSALSKHDFQRWFEQWYQWLATQWQPWFLGSLENHVDGSSKEFADLTGNIELEKARYLRNFQGHFSHPALLAYFDKSEGLPNQAFVDELYVIANSNDDVSTLAVCFLIFSLSSRAINANTSPVWTIMQLLNHMQFIEIRDVISLRNDLNADDDDPFFRLLANISDPDIRGLRHVKAAIKTRALPQQKSIAFFDDHPYVRDFFYSAFSGLLHLMFLQVGLRLGGNNFKTSFQHISHPFALDIAQHANDRFCLSQNYIPIFLGEKQDSSIQTELNRILLNLSEYRTVDNFSACVEANSEYISSLLKNMKARYLLHNLAYAFSAESKALSEEVKLFELSDNADVEEFARVFHLRSNHNSFTFDDRARQLVSDFITALKKRVTIERPSLAAHLFNAFDAYKPGLVFLKEIYYSYIKNYLHDWIKSSHDFKLLFDLFFMVDKQGLCDWFLQSDLIASMKDTDIKVLIEITGDVQFGVSLIGKWEEKVKRDIFAYSNSIFEKLYTQRISSSKLLEVLQIYYNNIISMLPARYDVEQQEFLHDFLFQQENQIQTSSVLSLFDFKKLPLTNNDAYNFLISCVREYKFLTAETGIKIARQFAAWFTNNAGKLNELIHSALIDFQNALLNEKIDHLKIEDGFYFLSVLFTLIYHSPILLSVVSLELVSQLCTQIWCFINDTNYSDKQRLALKLLCDKDDGQFRNTYLLSYMMQNKIPFSFCLIFRFGTADEIGNKLNLISIPEFFRPIESSEKTICELLLSRSPSLSFLSPITKIVIVDLIKENPEYRVLRMFIDNHQLSELLKEICDGSEQSVSFAEGYLAELIRDKTASIRVTEMPGVYPLRFLQCNNGLTSPYLATLFYFAHKYFDVKSICDRLSVEAQRLLLETMWIDPVIRKDLELIKTMDGEVFSKRREMFTEPRA